MAADARPRLDLGLVAAPGTPYQLAGDLVGRLTAVLDDRLPAVRWRIIVVEDRLATSEADVTELVAAGRERLLAEDWDLVICLTDLPLEVAHRPALTHASSVHGVGVLSVPALGAVGLHRRLPPVVVGLVDTLLGEPESQADPAEAADQQARLARRARELASTVEHARGPAFTLRVLTGNLRLLAGMIRANQPWRLALELSRALTAAIAAGVFALVTPDIWRLADAYGAFRLTGVAVGAVTAVAVALILGAGLWEHTRGRRMRRRQVVLFNLATVGTVGIGVLAFYAALFVVSAVATPLLIVGHLLAGQLGHPVGVTDYLKLAWLTSSLATAGGALGAGLESDEAVREAAYTNRVADDDDDDRTEADESPAGG